MAACALLIVSCFMHWAWYPDIEKNFTGFFTQGNYYGRPGRLLSFFGATGIVFYFLRKNWSDRLNLIFSALCAAYAFTSFLRYTSSYDGFVPEKKIGIFIMLFSSLVHLAATMLNTGLKKTEVNSTAI